MPPLRCEVAKPVRTIENLLLATQNGGAISNALFTIHFMVSNATLGLVGPPCGVPNIGLDYGQNIVMTQCRLC